MNVHPGELLREEFLQPRGITAKQFAKDAKLPLQRVKKILQGKLSITAEIDRSLCAYFNQISGYWLRVQSAHDQRRRRQHGRRRDLSQAAKDATALKNSFRVENERLIAEGREDEIHRRQMRNLGVSENARGRLVSFGGYRIR
ncbi:MAG: HigA family addiction module antidote protein [Candidatus Didemnitutus sp.]|nr:HigA family addiction module antidote protein [Candidatus Didemnitutus sp.]